MYLQSILSFIFMICIHTNTINLSLQISLLCSLSFSPPFLSLPLYLLFSFPSLSPSQKLKGKIPVFNSLALFYLWSPLLQEIIYLNYMVCPHEAWRGGLGICPVGFWTTRVPTLCPGSWAWPQGTL